MVGLQTCALTSVGGEIERENWRNGQRFVLAKCAHFGATEPASDFEFCPDVDNNHHTSRAEWKRAAWRSSADSFSVFKRGGVCGWAEPLSKNNMAALSNSDEYCPPESDIFEHGHGHFFTKKTFHKPTYCHHCTDMLWGLIGQGYVCEGGFFFGLAPIPYPLIAELL